MDVKILARESIQLLEKDLSITINCEASVADPFEEIHRVLTRQIQYLLDHDFNRLLLALYRIDISEKKIKDILSQTEPGKIASTLSSVIIEREKLKVVTRKKYSS